MSENKYTPGPWQIEYESNEIHNGGNIQITVNQKGRPYKHIMQDYNGKGVETAEANAKLIAAAPEILEELIRLRNWCAALTDWSGGTELDPPIESANVAIQKATI